MGGRKTVCLGVGAVEALCWVLGVLWPPRSAAAKSLLDRGTHTALPELAAGVRTVPSRVAVSLTREREDGTAVRLEYLDASIMSSSYSLELIVLTERALSSLISGIPYLRSSRRIPVTVTLQPSTLLLEKRS